MTETEPVAHSILDDRGIVSVCPHCGAKNRIPYERLGDTGRCSSCRDEVLSPDAPIDVSNEALFYHLIQQSALPVVVDFWAPWCGPCRMVAPELVKVAAAGQGRWVVAKVNTEALPGLATRFAIRGIPTMAVFAGGREAARTSGARPALAIQAFVEQALSSTV